MTPSITHLFDTRGGIIHEARCEACNDLLRGDDDRLCHDCNPLSHTMGEYDEEEE